MKLRLAPVARIVRHVLISGALCVLACDSSSGDSSSAADGESTASESAETETAGDGDLQCGESTCASAEYCNWLDNKCGMVPDTPMCRANEENCAADQPVCGCDGEVYPSACEANAVGIDVGEFTCEPPAGRFGCGTRLCSLDTEVCEHVPSAGFAPASVWTCLAVPPECANDWTCACILPIYEQQMSCTSTPACTEGGDVGVQIECDQGV
jgi:hypothetical protein